MWKRLLFLGSLVLSPVAAMGQTAGPADSVAYSYRPGQGNFVTVVVPPAPVAQPPYALTGDNSAIQAHLTTYTYGNSGPVMVYFGQ